ncbi:MAG: hypothetical protein MZV70_12240 [Desulfobacterales bacterium]|nr:hypothetical protein [Desulfobacterales bacterium]
MLDSLFRPKVRGRHRCVHQGSFHRQPGDQEPGRFRLHGDRVPHQPQRGRGPRDQGLQVDPGLPGQHRCGAHGHPGQVRAPGGGRVRQERGQAHHHQLRRVLGNRRRGHGHRKGLPGDEPSATASAYWVRTARGSSTATPRSAPTATSPSRNRSRASSPSSP